MKIIDKNAIHRTFLTLLFFFKSRELMILNPQWSDKVSRTPNPEISRVGPVVRSRHSLAEQARFPDSTSGFYDVGFRKMVVDPFFKTLRHLTRPYKYYFQGDFSI